MTLPTALSQALRELGVKTYAAQAVLLGLHVASWARYRRGGTVTTARAAEWLRCAGLRATWEEGAGWVVEKPEPTCGVCDRPATRRHCGLDVCEDSVCMVQTVNSVYMMREPL